MHLTAENLGVRRGEDFIFMNISFKLSDGEALVLTGRNGSGKSTLLRTVAGLLRPEQGSVKIAGEGIDEEIRPSEACHYLGHRNAMKTELTVFENLRFWKDFLGDFRGAAGISIDEAAEIIGLAGITHLPYGYLSAGQQRRFAMAKLLVAWRPVWILDEPSRARQGGRRHVYRSCERPFIEGRHRDCCDTSAPGANGCAGIADDGVCGCGGLGVMAMRTRLTPPRSQQ